MTNYTTAGGSAPVDVALVLQLPRVARLRFLTRTGRSLTKMAVTGLEGIQEEYTPAKRHHSTSQSHRWEIGDTGCANS